MTLKTMTTLFGLVAALLMITMPAQADDHRIASMSTQTQLVKYNDLNLANQAGLQTLYKRLEVAVDRVCGPTEDIRDLKMSQDRRRCVQDALDSAVANVNLPLLSRIHEVATGRLVETGGVARAR